MIDKSKAVSLSGNRQLLLDFDKDKLKFELEALIKKGFNSFLCGMAVGFDTECFLILKELREIHPINIYACVPCKDQDKSFSDNDKEIYRLLLKESDEIILLSEYYYNGCMIVRNKFMVDNSSVLLCYNRKNSGGAFYTLNYAKKCGLDIIEL